MGMRWSWSFRLTSVRGVPVYVHASLPLGLLLMSGFSFKPLRWLGLVIIVLVHELGHALLFRRFRLPVIGITLHGAGGECASTGWATPVQESIVAWGGVLAQLGLFTVVTALAELGVWPEDASGRELYSVLAVLNVVLVVINLVPLGRLDGARAWRLLWFAYLGLKRAWLARRLGRLAKKKRAAHLRSLH
jgi:Zn-dependent protease